MTASPTPRHIAITGASSGLGAALALEYAGPGIRLSLHGRDTDRTEAVAAAARSRGAEVDVTRFDVTDADAVAAWVTAIGARAPLDLLIANAGAYGRVMASRYNMREPAGETALERLTETPGSSSARISPMRSSCAGAA